MDPWSEFHKQVTDALAPAYNGDPKLAEPTDSLHGDLATAICFTLARTERKPPAEIASRFVLDKKFDLIAKVENLNGYLNFFINWNTFAQRVVTAATAKDFGTTKEFSGHVVVEFPSVNPNKPWHIGHARNAVLGDTLSNLLTAVGYTVTRLNYINDLGVQVAKTFLGLPVGKGKYDQELGLKYVEMEEKADETAVRELLKKMEDGKAPKVRAMAEKCLEAQTETAERLRVSTDLIVFESDLVHSGIFAEGVTKIKSSKFVKQGVKKEGCLVADLSGFEEFKNLEDTELVLLRSDGTATYTAKDIAFHMWKFGVLKDKLKYKKFLGSSASSVKGSSNKYKPASIVFNVIGSEQAHPQRLLQLTFKALGYEREYENYYHLSYEHVWLPEGKFSGRKGTWIGFSTDTVLHEAYDRALLVVEEKNSKLKTKEKEKIAEAIGSSAVRYTLLKTAPEKKITFQWEEALSFEGNAAPYLIYSHARAARILEEKSPKSKPRAFTLNESEKELLKLIAKYPNLLVATVRNMNREIWGTKISLNAIPEYAHSLASAFAKFYTQCRVLNDPMEEQRLWIVRAFAQTLNSCLTLMGLVPLERM